MDIKKCIQKNYKQVLIFILRALLNGHILYYIYWLIQIGLEIYSMMSDYDPYYYYPSSPSPNESFPVAVIITLLLITLMVVCYSEIKKMYSIVWRVINLCMGFFIVYFVTAKISIIPIFILALFLVPRPYIPTM